MPSSASALPRFSGSRHLRTHGNVSSCGRGLDRWTVSGLPCRRDWNPDLSGGGVGSRLVKHHSELGRRRHQGTQAHQTSRVGGCADDQQISLGDREQKLRALLGSNPVQKFNRRTLIGRTEVTSCGPFRIEANALPRSRDGMDRDPMLAEIAYDRKTHRRICAQQDGRRQLCFIGHRTGSHASDRRSSERQNR